MLKCKCTISSQAQPVLQALVDARMRPKDISEVPCDKQYI